MGHSVGRPVETRYFPSVLPLRSTYVASPQDKVNLLAEYLEATFTPNEYPSDAQFTRTVENTSNTFLNRLINYMIKLTDLQEIFNIITHLPLRKAPGPHEIPNIVIRRLSPKALIYLTNIISAVLRLHHFPSHWKIARVLVFPKPSKDHTNPANYRPIISLNTLGKILEKVILRRINKFIYKKSILRPDQFGFSIQTFQNPPTPSSRRARY
jgi:hypothetical protein